MTVVGQTVDFAGKYGLVALDCTIYKALILGRSAYLANASWRLSTHIPTSSQHDHFSIITLRSLGVPSFTRSQVS